MTATPSLDAGALDRLLGFLGEGDDERGSTYRTHHERLARLFRFKGCGNAEELADRTLDRVARKLAQGGVPSDRDPAAYLLTVARFIYLEEVKARTRQREREREEAAFAARDEGAEIERNHRALEACLQELGEVPRERLLRYHAGSGQRRIDARQALAKEWQLSLQNLRVRVFRLRARVEACVRARLSGDLDKAT